MVSKTRILMVQIFRLDMANDITYIHTYLYYSQRKIQTPRKKAKHLEDTLAHVTLSNKARLVSTTRYFEITLSYYQRLISETASTDCNEDHFKYHILSKALSL